MVDQPRAFPFPRTDPLAPPPAYAELAGSPCRVRLASGDEPWLVTRHADVRAVLADPTMSTDLANPDLPRVSALSAGPNVLSFLKMDEPDHGVLRRMVAAEFTARGIQPMRPRIQDIADSLVDAMTSRDEPVDLMAAFAAKLPCLVICELLGVPAEDRDQVQRWSGLIASSTADPMRIGEALQQITIYLDQVVAAAEKEPRDDLVGRLASGYVATGELSHDDMVSMVRLLVIAGLENPVQMIGMGVLTLLRHPEQLALLRADPGLIPGAVDELLRYLSIPQYGIVRAATEDTSVGGVAVAKGDGVVIGLPAANHDPSVYPDPGTLDVRRDASRHVSFGHGVHQCIGRSLAVVELSVAIDTLLRRLPNLRLAVDFAEIRFRGDDSFVYGVAELPVMWR
ncbi:cytochrome P450 [Actinocrispum wychmicini]|uniref:Cytochrome P450 n=1 Tax=Actinocrispum wychmicini TaxID=1213861 RepID=A0A4R2JT62_9PSEU|nr:cytochrome P450 [Actinocrispum wychmicini]TCO62317.1 cytochrome P450 [Actinocrispum wychmicini]